MIKVYDFDGTILPFNSFKVWLLFSLFVSVLCFRILFFARLFKLSCSRFLFGGIKREEYKRDVLLFQYNSKFWLFMGGVFGHILTLFIREGLIKDDGDGVILATAAPDIYIKPIIKKYSFNQVVATSICGKKMVEAIGETKLNLLRNILKYDHFIFYTDHIDDIPTAKNAHCVYLCSKDPVTIKKFNRLGTPVVLVKL